MSDAPPAAVARGARGCTAASGWRHAANLCQVSLHSCALAATITCGAGRGWGHGSTPAGGAGPGMQPALQHTASTQHRGAVAGGRCAAAGPGRPRLLELPPASHPHSWPVTHARCSRWAACEACPRRRRAHPAAGAGVAHAVVAGLAHGAAGREVHVGLLLCRLALLHQRGTGGRAQGRAPPHCRRKRRAWACSPSTHGTVGCINVAPEPPASWAHAGAAGPAGGACAGPPHLLLLQLLLRSREAGGSLRHGLLPALGWSPRARLVVVIHRVVLLRAAARQAGQWAGAGCVSLPACAPAAQLALKEGVSCPGKNGRLGSVQVRTGSNLGRAAA